MEYKLSLVFPDIKDADAILDKITDFLESEYGEDWMAVAEPLNTDNVIYTRDEAMLIIEAFESILQKFDISVPSPEDDEREDGDAFGLYGTTYSDLLDEIEDMICHLLERDGYKSSIVRGMFSGKV